VTKTEIQAILDTFDEKYDAPVLAAIEAKIHLPRAVSRRWPPDV